MTERREIVIDGIRMPTKYTQEAMESILSRMEEEALSQVFDMNVKRERDACKSLAYKVAQTKQKLEMHRKNVLADVQKTLNETNAVGRYVRNRLDSLKEKVRSPLTEWENEQARIKAEEERKAREIEEARIAKEEAIRLENQRKEEARLAKIQRELDEQNEELRRRQAEIDAKEKAQKEKEEKERLAQEAKERAEREAELKIQRAKDAEREANIKAEQLAQQIKKEQEEKELKVALEKKRQAQLDEHIGKIQQTLVKFFVDNYGIEAVTAEALILDIANNRIDNIRLVYTDID